MRIFEAPFQSKKEIKKSETIKYLDALWRKAVMKKYRGKSYMSSFFNADVVHHLITRKRKNTRWDIDNGIPLTVGEHALIHQKGGFKDYFIDNYFGREKYEKLQRKSVQYFDKDYGRIKKTLIEALMR